jgi:flavodoxin/cell division protein FtsL
MKILIAYYSKKGKTERLAREIQKKLTKKGYRIDLERIRVAKEKNSFFWFIHRILKSKTEIIPPRVKDVSEYDVICFGSPDWFGISLPISSFIDSIKGLKNKKVAIFGPTFLFPKDLFTLSSFVFDASFCNEVEKRGAKIAGRLFLSGKLEEKDIFSDKTQERIKVFCGKIEAPALSFKEYFLQKREIESARLFLSLFLILMAGSAVFQIANIVLKEQSLAWLEYISLLVSSFLSALVLLTALSYRKSLSFVKYFSVFSFILLFTMAVILFSFNLKDSIIIEYILLFALFSFFRNTKVILFAGLMSFSSYGLLYFSNHVFYPLFDLSAMALSVVIITYVTRNLQNSHVKALEAQDDAEIAQSSLEIKIQARTRELLILSQKLEEQVEGRTKELKSKIAELERFNRLAIGRELKMIELKNKVKELEKNVKKHR